jgi:hypothetical protein
VNARLAALARHGIVAVWHLRAVGLNGTAVSKRCKRGVLHRQYPGVYSLGHAELSREARWIAAVYAAGPGAALGLLSATAHLDLRRYAPHIPQVVVPRRHKPIEGIELHACRRLDPLDVTVYRGIPVTTVARTLVDLTDFATTEELANLIHEAAFRKRFNLAATRAAMRRANGRHNLDRLEAAIEAHLAGSAGTMSRNETAFLALLEHHGIPKPIANTHVLGHRVDCLWPDHRLVVEVDGPGHSRPRTRREDQRRDRELIAAGYRVLRFTDQQIELRPADVVAALVVLDRDRTVLPGARELETGSQRDA